jgi:ferredoxin-NADP reductase
MDKIIEIYKLLTDFPRIRHTNCFNFVKKENELGNIWSFYFQPPKDFNIEAGEHLLLKLPHENSDNRGEIRFYTPSSAPHERYIRITTRYFGNKSSTFKQELFSMSEGDEITARGPLGKFTIDDKELGNQFTFIAKGVGITPFRSLLLDLDKKKIFPKVDLFYLNRDEEILFKPELDKIAESHSSFKVHYLSVEDSIPKSSIKESASKKALFYIAGAPDFVEERKKMLRNNDVSALRIKNDPFRTAKGGIR